MSYGTKDWSEINSGEDDLPEGYMKFHHDSITPLQMLEDRLKQIDNYILRLEKSGNTGSDFFRFYKNKSIEFLDAIKKLKAS